MVSYLVMGDLLAHDPLSAFFSNFSVDKAKNAVVHV